MKLKAIYLGFAGVLGAAAFVPMVKCAVVIACTVKDCKGKTVIVTGATGNLGGEMAYELAKKKARVIMACRDMEKCKIRRREIMVETKNRQIVCRKLDLEDIDSINQFVENISATEPRIDVLINNAAIVNHKTKELTKYGIEKTFFVNFLAPVFLSLRLMDKLKETAELLGEARIVNVIGSPRSKWVLRIDDINFEKRKYTGWKAYYQSKLALAYATRLLDEQLIKDGRKVFVYGSSPIYWGIAEFGLRTTSFRDDIKNFWRRMFLLDPFYCVQSALVVALESYYARRVHSGHLYSLFSMSWGWGVAAKNDTESKLVWNKALNTLLECSEMKFNPPKDKDKA